MRLRIRRGRSEISYGHIPRGWILVVCFMCLFLLKAVESNAEIHVSNDFSYTFNDIVGPGKDQSSLTDGFRYLNVLGINGNGTVSGYDYHFNVGTRLTDDKRNDIQTFVLTNLRAGLTNKIHTFNFGDTFQAFSQYSLSTSLKGGSYRFSKNNSGLPEVVLIYGFANSRWDNFHGFGESQIDALYREVAGGKISYSLLEDLKAGFSIVRSDDTDRVNPGDELSEVLSYTLDWEYNPIPGLTINGESSFADATISPSDSEPDVDLDGHAHKLTAVGDGGPSRVTLEYERVEPDFRTVVGSATSDREKAKIRWRYKYSRRNSITTGFLWYRNNLDGDLDARTDHYKPEVSLTTRRVFGRKYASADLSYKLDITQKDREDTSRVDHIVNLNYRDRFGVLDSDSNFGFTAYHIKETPEGKNLEYIYNTSLNSRFHVDQYILKPSITLGGWTSREELEDTTDQIYEYSLGLGIDVPTLKITSNFKIGHNKLDKDGAGSDSLKAFARLNIYYRPGFLSGLRQGMLFLRANINDYEYDRDDGDFRETSITTGVNIQF